MKRCQELAIEKVMEVEAKRKRKDIGKISLSKLAPRYATFVTGFGTHASLRMPFGLLNAPDFFIKLMSPVVENCEDFVVPYLDDVAIDLNSWEDYLKHTDEVLRRVNESNLTIKTIEMQICTEPH
ncbi:reverse transcriptase [Caerostris extrusa]|uniref:Reverse transcriptase n=1 Tax=Caerostris extrusa TaxID=172846 RepID=A0AAV4WJ26_CAEEX|nr:reverse transcriptase [Caerostris extrusa]